MKCLDSMIPFKNKNIKNISTYLKGNFNQENKEKYFYRGGNVIQIRSQTNWNTKLIIYDILSIISERKIKKTRGGINVAGQPISWAAG